MSSAKCIVDDFGGSSHPYRYCVKPLKEMIDYDKIKRESGSFNMVGITEGASAIGNYATALIADPTNAISQECDGILGNKYMLKSAMKCKNMDENVHSYINNVVEYNFITDRNTDDDGPLGVIPATIGSALSINGAPLIRALYEDPQQNCIKVTLPCHLVVKKKKGDTAPSPDSYSGPVDDVPITISEYDRLVGTGDIRPTSEQKAFREDLRKPVVDETEGYTNLHESIYGYLNDNPVLLNTDGENTDENKEEDDVDADNDMISNLYYLTLSIFLLYLIFKLTTKK
tara:strand:- start:328 stop:1185 length:858 start_codon:yes stop_codon:yes gene_type:complete